MALRGWFRRRVAQPFFAAALRLARVHGWRLRGFALDFQPLRLLVAHAFFAAAERVARDSVLRRRFVLVRRVDFRVDLLVTGSGGTG